MNFGWSEGGGKTIFSQTSALVKETVTQLSTVPVGFFSLLASHWASAIAVWLLRVWCSRNVLDIDVKLPAKWFHIRASCVIELGAVRYPALSENNHSDSRCSGLELFEMLIRPACYTPVEALQPSHVSFWKSVVFLINQHPKHFISSKHVSFLR